jgi:photosystem II stability/assembly factor-like uncharacterized protein
MNDNEMNDDLEKRLQGYYSEFTPESSGRAVAGVDRALADRRAYRGRPLAAWVARLGVRGVGALAGVAVAIALVAALFPLWGRTGIGPATNGSTGPVGPASSFVDQAGVARDGSVWAIRGRGLAISRDHGQTWAEHELPTDAVFPGNLALADADHAWVLDPSGADVGSSNGGASVVVYRTSDGGATWQYTSVAATSPNPIFSQIRFVDSKVGFLVLGNDGTGTDPAKTFGTSIIMRTEDGGATWDPTGTITTAIQAGAASSPDPSSSPDSSGSLWFSTGPVIPVDADTLWTYCGIPVFAPAQDSCPLLQVSRDAGATWTPVALPGVSSTGNEALAVPALTGVGVDGVQFISPAEGYVAVRETVGNNDHDRIHYFRTTDAGRTWSQVALTEWQQVAVPPIFIDSQHWFQPGLETLVIPHVGATNEFVESQGMNVTSDGGKTWRNVAVSMGQLLQVWMSDAQHGAALKGQLLYLTSDGGETWQPASIAPAQWPNPSQALVTVPPSQSGYPAGSQYAEPSGSSVALPSGLPSGLPANSPATSPAGSPPPSPAAS